MVPIIHAKPPLHKAVLSMNLNLVLDLISKGADVNETDDLENSTLHLAARCQNREIARVLMDSGASRECRNFLGRTPLHEAARHKNSPLVEQLISRKVDVNARDSNDSTPLLDLVASPCDNEIQRVRLAELLLKNRADVDARSETGSTPLYLGVINGNVRVVELLLKHGAKTNVEYRNGDTELHIAVQSGNSEMVQLLVNGGADVDYKNPQNKMTPLHWACRRYDKKIVSCLLKKGARVNARDSSGQTPLSEAVLAASGPGDRRIDTLEYLLTHGADVNAYVSGFKNVLNVFSDERRRRIILQRIAKRKVLDLPLRKSLLESVSKDQDYFDECQRELQLAKSTRIHRDYPVTFLDLMITSDVNVLESFIKNKYLIETLESGEYQKTFQIYSSWIKRKLENGVRIRWLQIRAERSLSFCFEKFGVPTELVTEIRRYLKIKDLTNVCNLKTRRFERSWGERKKCHLARIRCIESEFRQKLLSLFLKQS